MKTRTAGAHLQDAKNKRFSVQDLPQDYDRHYDQDQVQELNNVKPFNKPISDNVPSSLSSTILATIDLATADVSETGTDAAGTTAMLQTSVSPPPSILPAHSTSLAINTDADIDTGSSERALPSGPDSDGIPVSTETNSHLHHHSINPLPDPPDTTAKPVIAGTRQSQTKRATHGRAGAAKAKYVRDSLDNKYDADVDIGSFKRC